MDMRHLTIIVGGDLVVRLMGRLAREMEALQQEIAQAAAASPPGDPLQLAALLQDASAELQELAEAIERARGDGIVIRDGGERPSRPLRSIEVWDVLDAKDHVAGTYALERDARQVVLAHASEGWKLRGPVQTLTEAATSSKCSWCDKGFPRIASAVKPGGFIHNVGLVADNRVACLEESA